MPPPSPPQIPNTHISPTYTLVPKQLAYLHPNAQLPLSFFPSPNFFSTTINRRYTVRVPRPTPSHPSHLSLSHPVSYSRTLIHIQRSYFICFDRSAIYMTAVIFIYNEYIYLFSPYFTSWCAYSFTLPTYSSTLFFFVSSLRIKYSCLKFDSILLCTILRTSIFHSPSPTWFYPDLGLKFTIHIRPPIIPSHPSNANPNKLLLIVAIVMIPFHKSATRTRGGM
jgi:hypothetical protein